MKKIISAFIIMILVTVGLSSCGIKKDSGKENQNPVMLTAKSTVVYNHFKDRIPEFKFSNTPIEKYEDGLSYVLSVGCSEKEYKNCIKKLKKAGFENNPVEADTYYSATDNMGYYVEVTYVGKMLMVYISAA